MEVILLVCVELSMILKGFLGGKFFVTSCTSKSLPLVCLILMDFEGGPTVVGVVTLLTLVLTLHHGAYR